MICLPISQKQLNKSQHTSEQFEDGMFRIYFGIDSITGPAPAAVGFKINFYSEPSLQGPVSVQTSQKMVQGTDVHTGNIGYVEFPAKTTFFAVDGDWGMAGYNGNTSVAPYPNEFCIFAK